MPAVIRSLAMSNATQYAQQDEFLFDVAGSKSHSIRALLLASLTTQTVYLSNVLDSQDTQSMYAFLDARAVVYERIDKKDSTEPELIKLIGMGRRPRFTTHFVDLMNSGTSLFFATAMLGFSTDQMTLVGDESLRRRTADALLDALRELGAVVVERSPRLGCPPYTVSGPVHSGSVEIICPTSQYLSALLLVLSFTAGQSTIKAQLSGEHPYVEMTLQWLSKFGARISHTAYRDFIVQGIDADPQLLGPQGLSPDKPLHIAGDYSSSAFLCALAPIIKKNCLIRGLVKNDTQADSGFLDILVAMGCDIEWISDEAEMDVLKIIPPHLHRAGSRDLIGGEFDLSAMPDSLPILAVLSCFAKTPTRIHNVAHARIKETDRIQVMYQELTKMGAHISTRDDGLVIDPRKAEKPHNLRAAKLQSHGDHRVAMSLTIAGLGAYSQTTELDDHQVASITFPQFYSQLNKQFDNCIVY